MSDDVIIIESMGPRMCLVSLRPVDDCEHCRQRPPGPRVIVVGEGAGRPEPTEPEPTRDELIEALELVLREATGAGSTSWAYNAALIHAADVVRRARRDGT
jgi:hypothetical protein